MFKLTGGSHGEEKNETQSDEKETGEITRQVIYNFPPEYLRSNEIELSGQPPAAKFKLVPIPPAK